MTDEELNQIRKIVREEIERTTADEVVYPPLEVDPPIPWNLFLAMRVGGVA